MHIVSDQVGLLAAVQPKVQTPFCWAMTAGGALLGIGMAAETGCTGKIEHDD
jgi:hypothetical protein